MLYAIVRTCNDPVGLRGHRYGMEIVWEYLTGDLKPSHENER